MKFINNIFQNYVYKAWSYIAIQIDSAAFIFKGAVFGYMTLLYLKRAMMRDTPLKKDSVKSIVNLSAANVLGIYDQELGREITEMENRLKEVERSEYDDKSCEDFEEYLDAANKRVMQFHHLAFRAHILYWIRKYASNGGVLNSFCEQEIEKISQVVIQNDFQKKNTLSDLSLIRNALKKYEKFSTRQLELF